MQPRRWYNQTELWGSVCSCSNGSTSDRERVSRGENTWRGYMQEEWAKLRECVSVWVRERGKYTWKGQYFSQWDCYRRWDIVANMWVDKFENVSALFEVSTAVNMKKAVFLDVMQRGSSKNGRSGVIYRLHHQGGKNRRVRNNVISN
jgi:hypothetical protein